MLTELVAEIGIPNKPGVDSYKVEEAIYLIDKLESSRFKLAELLRMARVELVKLKEQV
jgi:hypothetical protein